MSATVRFAKDGDIRTVTLSDGTVLTYRWSVILDRWVRL